MTISNRYVVVEKLEEKEVEGFKTVEVLDNFVYKGKISFVPEQPAYIDNKLISVDDIILFAKYSPDTHEIDWEGRKVKFVAISDILAII